MSFGNCFSNCGNRRNLMQPVKTVKALLDTVIDSCCKYEEIQKDVVIPINSLPGLCDLEVGDTLPIEVNGPICCREVKREEVLSDIATNHCLSCAAVHACLNDTGNCGFDPCTTLSTVLCMFPLKITDPFDDDDSLCQTFTSLNTVELDSTHNSQIDCHNSKILTLAAVVTSIDPEFVVVAVCIGCRLCLRQVEKQEHCLNVGIAVGHRCNDVDLLGTAGCFSCTGLADTAISPVAIPEKNCSCDCKMHHHPKANQY